MHNFAAADLAPAFDETCDLAVAAAVRELTYARRGAPTAVWSTAELALSHTNDLAKIDHAVTLLEGPSSAHRLAGSLCFDPPVTALRLRQAAELCAGSCSGGM